MLQRSPWQAPHQLARWLLDSLAHSAKCHMKHDMIICSSCLTKSITLTVPRSRDLSNSSLQMCTRTKVSLFQLCWMLIWADSLNRARAFYKWTVSTIKSKKGQRRSKLSTAKITLSMSYWARPMTDLSAWETKFCPRSMNDWNTAWSIFNREMIHKWSARANSILSSRVMTTQTSWPKTLMTIITICQSWRS